MRSCRTLAHLAHLAHLVHDEILSAPGNHGMGEV